MNPAAMVALIDYREIDGEERPVTPMLMLITVLLQFLYDFEGLLNYSVFTIYLFLIMLQVHSILQVIMFFKHGLEEEKV